jgi:hypothetical protein
MTSVFRPRDISIDSESPIDTSNLFTCNSFWYKFLDPIPELVMESLIDNPVEVVG